MWARVKGETENALLALPFKRAYMYRPGFIQPMHGVEVTHAPPIASSTRITTPLFQIVKLVSGKSAITTEDVGRAMIEAAANGAPKPAAREHATSRIWPPSRQPDSRFNCSGLRRCSRGRRWSGRRSQWLSSPPM